MDGVDFSEEPWAAGTDLGHARILMEAEFAALNEFEVLDSVGDVDLGALDVEFVHDAVENFAGGAYEGFALEIFLIAGLFTDEDEFCVGCSCAGNDLGSVLVEVASFA